MGHQFALHCSRCNLTFSPIQPNTLCSCGSPLLVDYDLRQIRKSWDKASLFGSVASMWRYGPVLPASPEEAITLGEGWTPLHRVKQLEQELGGRFIWVKDEAQNPTDSFKARGLSAAVTMAKKFGFRKVAIPSAGNAASALAAYAARAQMEAHIFMPRDVPQANFLECVAFGAQVTLVDGLISDCGRIVAEKKASEKWFDVSTLKEPYRIEGKKTMGYEIAEQFDWQLPDAILYPCGGGVGLIGMWKAFAELGELGWIPGKRPKMIAVQAAGCAPITRAFEQKKDESDYWNGAHTIASGLRVPKALGDFLVLRAVRESGGTAISIPDEQMIDAALLLAQLEGIFPAPETGACIAALRELFRSGFLARDEKVVIFNTGSGLKYLEAYNTRFSRQSAAEEDKLGGLITPR